MTGREGFEVIDGGRDDDDPTSQDDANGLAALADVIGGPESQDDPDVEARARRAASDIMGMPDDSSPGLRSVEGPPAP